eukprot:2338220-Prymnesium_polylepis.1
MATRRHSNQRRDTGADGSALRGRPTATTYQSPHRHVPRASHGTAGRAAARLGSQLLENTSSHRHVPRARGTAGRA